MNIYTYETKKSNALVVSNSFFATMLLQLSIRITPFIYSVFLTEINGYNP